MGQLFDTTHDQMNILSCNNSLALTAQGDHSNPQTTSLGKVECTGNHFAWYSRNDPKATVEPPGGRQYKRRDILAHRPQNCDEIIDGHGDN